MRKEGQLGEKKEGCISQLSRIIPRFNLHQLLYLYHTTVTLRTGMSFMAKQRKGESNKGKESRRRRAILKRILAIVTWAARLDHVVQLGLFS